MLNKPVVVALTLCLFGCAVKNQSYADMPNCDSRGTCRYSDNIFNPYQDNLNKHFKSEYTDEGFEGKTRNKKPSKNIYFDEDPNYTNTYKYKKTSTKKYASQTVSPEVRVFKRPTKKQNELNGNISQY